MKREPYFINKNIAGTYNLSILRNHPFGSWYYSGAGTFDTYEEALRHYHQLKEDYSFPSKMNMRLLKSKK